MKVVVPPAEPVETVSTSEHYMRISLVQNGFVNSLFTISLGIKIVTITTETLVFRQMNIELST